MISQELTKINTVKVKTTLFRHYESLNPMETH
jgi:hypothetical protein